jgi:hypothetical protein
VEIVVGLNARHTIFSQMLVAMKSEIPLPKPYPFYKNSSRIMTISPATANYKMIARATVAPMTLTSPYIPLIT